jgi:hypothetical protein
VRAEAEKAEASMQRELFDAETEDEDAPEPTSSGDVEAPGQSSVGAIASPTDEADSNDEAEGAPAGEADDEDAPASEDEEE